MKPAYYNEFDKGAAAWLRELIAEGHIAPGDVDERSIEDVRPDDLRGYGQCHFFAGIGGWSRALRLAGVPDDYPIWTGSCPCQPFSTAGEGAGFADERHLWPLFHYLIQERRPRGVLGEQTAGSLVDPWVDLVQDDLEGLGYAFGAVAFPSSGIGAPHIRDRTYWGGWLGDADLARLEGFGLGHLAAQGHGQGAVRPAAAPGGVVWLGHADGVGAGRDGRAVCGPVEGQDGQHAAHHAHAPGPAGGLGHADGIGRPALAVAGLCHEEPHPEPRGGAGGLADADSECQESAGDGAWSAEFGRAGEALRLADAASVGRVEGRGLDGGHDARHGSADHGQLDDLGRPGPTNGFWRDADWLFCRDGKWRAVAPGTFPLAHGVSERVALLRGAGNAVNVYAAKAFVEAFLGSA